MKLGRVLLTVWIVASVTVLILVLVAYQGRPNDDAEVILIYGMAALAFPLSVALLWASGYVIASVSSAFGWFPTTTYLTLIVEWMCFFMVGYLQWFKLAPWLIRAVRRSPEV